MGRCKGESGRIQEEKKFKRRWLSGGEIDFGPSPFENWREIKKRI